MSEIPSPETAAERAEYWAWRNEYLRQVNRTRDPDERAADIDHPIDGLDYVGDVVQEEEREDLIEATGRHLTDDADRQAVKEWADRLEHGPLADLAIQARNGRIDHDLAVQIRDAAQTRDPDTHPMEQADRILGNSATEQTGPTDRQEPEVIIPAERHPGRIRDRDRGRDDRAIGL